MSGECNCEHEWHEWEDGAQCPGGPTLLAARAEHVGAICDRCARECLRDYLTEVGGVVVSEQWRQSWCHVGGDGLPSCFGHTPARVVLAEATVEANTGEILADFYGPGRMAHARAFALSLASQSTGSESVDG